MAKKKTKISEPEVTVRLFKRQMYLRTNGTVDLELADKALQRYAKVHQLTPLAAPFTLREDGSRRLKVKRSD